jgi:hypothetical protein
VAAGQGKIVTAPPDFVGVGAQRSGTTWWFRTLLSHPQIRPPRKGRKELHFFEPYGARPMRDEDIPRYHDLFPRRPGQIAGEWTPRYMADAWTAPLLKRAAPDAKLLVMLRDPIERYRSGVVHRATRSPDARAEIVARDAIERGRYTSQLRGLLEVFERDRILVLQYERCRLDPIGQYRRTLEFLGVDDHVPEDVQRLRGTTMQSGKKPLWPDLQEALRVTLGPEVRALVEIVPDLDLDLWSNFSQLPSDDGVLA